MKRRQFSEISPSFFGNWSWFFFRTYREGTWNGNLPCNSGWMGTSPEMYGWFWENPRRIKNSRWDSKVSCLIKSASSSAIWRSRADKGRRLAPLNIKLFPAGSIDAAPASPFGPIRQPCWRTYKKRMTLCENCFIFSSQNWYFCDFKMLKLDVLSFLPTDAIIASQFSKN